MSFNISTPSEKMEQIRICFKERRLTFKLTQAGLANRSGVNINSLKRFEKTGQISFESLLKLSLVLECLSDFDQVCRPFIENQSLDSLLKDRKIPKRGSLT